MARTRPRRGRRVATSRRLLAGRPFGREDAVIRPGSSGHHEDPASRCVSRPRGADPRGLIGLACQSAGAGCGATCLDGCRARLIDGIGPGKDELARPASPQLSIPDKDPTPGGAGRDPIRSALTPLTPQRAVLSSFAEG